MSGNEAVGRVAGDIGSRIKKAVRLGELPKDLAATVTPRTDGSIDIRVDFPGGWEVAPAEQAVPDWAGFGTHVVQMSKTGRDILTEVEGIARQRVYGEPNVTWVATVWSGRALRPTDFPDLDPMRASVFLSFYAKGRDAGAALEMADFAVAEVARYSATKSKATQVLREKL